MIVNVIFAAMMRALVAFLFSLISLLLGGYTNGHASVHHNNSNDTPKYHVATVQQTRLGHLNLELPVVKNSSINEKREDYIGIDNEDEDLVCSRKQVIVSKALVALPHTFALNHFYNYPKNRLPFCSHLSYTSSYKYILQRVLRI